MRTLFLRFSLIALCTVSAVTSYFDEEIPDQSSYALASSKGGFLDPEVEAMINGTAPHTARNEAAVQKLDRLNKNISKVGSTASLSNDSDVACTDCGKVQLKKKIESPECTDRNSYLEDSLEKLGNENNLMGILVSEPSITGPVKNTCIRAALENSFSSVGSNISNRVLSRSPFRTCEGSGIGDHEVRPCVSDKYVNLIDNSLNLVSRCMLPMLSDDKAEQQDDMREMLGMFAQESGLHINAVSPSGASGIGQFTQAAIDSVNQNDLSRIRKQLSSPDVPKACGEIRDQIMTGATPMRSQKSLNCDRISIEKGNPVLNLVYSFAAIADSKRYLKKKYTDHFLFKRFFAGLNDGDKNLIDTKLAIWAHNTGLGGLNTPLMSLLNSKYRGRKVTNVDQFIKDLSVEMQTNPHPDNDSSSRIAETSGYENKIQNKLNELEGDGSCVQ